MRHHPLLLSLLVGCGVGTASQAPTPPADPAPTCGETEAPACLGIGPETDAPVPDTARVSVVGADLAPCSNDPVTGFFRDGLCRTGPRDRGVHVVCAEVDVDFLQFTADRGNDLSTPRPELGFAGLDPGDRWCLCADRWEEARRAGVAPRVVLDATHPAVLRSTTRAHLDTHAVQATP